MSKMRLTPLTTCPRCDHLCVGPSILPCSHLLCRRCILLLLDTKPGRDVDCPTCHSAAVPANTPGPPQVKHFPLDVGMERLVREKLIEQSGGRCSVPHPSPSSAPSHVCLECADVYCDSCSHVHRNSSNSKHHSLMPLEPLEPMDVPLKRHGKEAGVGQNQKDSLLQHTVDTEVERLQQAMSTCDQVVDGLKDLMTHRQDHRHLLEAYSRHLRTDDVSLSDVILRRCRHVRQECSSVAEADLENLRQMQSRKSPGDKVDTQDISQSSGTGWQRRLLQLTWTSDNMTVRVALSVLVTLLLALLMVILCPPPVVHDTADQAVVQPDPNPDPDPGPDPYTADQVVVQPDTNPNPYTADQVVLKTVKAPSSSLTGSLCGDHSCSSHYDDAITGVLVTTDRRVLLSLRKQQSIVVQRPSSGVQTVVLGCHPYGLTQLHSGLIAVTCPLSSEVLLVSLDSSDHQIQRIQTGKRYYRVTVHPVDNTLIVGTWPEPSIDVITLQGKVIRTFVDSRKFESLERVTSLTVANGHLLVTDVKREQIHRIHLSDPSPPPVKTFAKKLVPSPRDTVVDKAGNVFVVLGNGNVVVRSPEGHYRTLLTGRTDEKTYWRCRIALYDDRLLVVTVAITSVSWKSDVTEYQLVNQ